MSGECYMHPGTDHESYDNRTRAQKERAVPGECDLPEGYHWATEEEMSRPDAIVVLRTVDNTGRKYTHGEADVAVPNLICTLCKTLGLGHDGDHLVPWKLVPAHIRDSRGRFCEGGEKQTRSGRCQYGCDHADHYANDGHLGCVEA